MKLCLLFLFAVVVQFSTAEFAGAALRNKRQIPITPVIEFPANTQFTEDKVPILTRPYNRQSAAVHYPGPQGLDHYTHFVNDPYVNTENLESIIGQRPRQTQQQQVRRRPELRSGYESNSGDQIRYYSRSQQYSYPTTAAWTTTTTTAAPMPYYSQSSSSQYSQPQQSGYTYTQRYDSSYRRPYYSSGVGNDDWEIASQGDNHITYRRRQTESTWYPAASSSSSTYGSSGSGLSGSGSSYGSYGLSSGGGSSGLSGSGSSYGSLSSGGGSSSGSSSGRRTTYSSSSNTPRIQRFDTQTGQVSAQVVDMRNEREERQQRQYQRPETRSLDLSNSGTDSSGASAYWRGQLQQGTTTHRASNSWARPYTGSNDYYGKTQYGSSSISNYGGSSGNYYRTTSRPSFEPNYPIMNDRATAQKTAAGGPNTVVLAL